MHRDKTAQLSSCLHSYIAYKQQECVNEPPLRQIDLTVHLQCTGFTAPKLGGKADLTQAPLPSTLENMHCAEECGSRARDLPLRAGPTVGKSQGRCEAQFPSL